MAWIPIVLGLCYLGYLIFAAFSIRSGIFIKAICEIKQGKPLLTFDDGPHPVYTVQVLEILKKYKIKAMFFCIGKHVDKYPELAQKIREEGHWMGNHTYDHSISSTFFGWRKYSKQINRTNEAIIAATGQATTLFRPPFGVTNPSIAKAIKSCGMKTIGWNLRTFDTVTDDVDKIIDKISNNLNEKSIVLFHDTNEICIKVLVKYLENNSHRFSSKIQIELG